MGLAASCLGSCLASCACSACTSAVSSCCGSGKKGSYLPYLLILFFSTALALILYLWGQPLIVHLTIKDIILCDSDACYGFGAVARISFSLFLFFLGHSLLLLASSCRKLDSASWGLRSLMLLVIFIGVWFIPSQFYDVYTHVSRVVSGIFLVIQVIILIDFAYSWNEDWTSEYKGWFKGVIAVSLLLIGACITLTVFLFRWFTTTRIGAESCSTNMFFIVFTLILTVGMTLLSISSYVKGGGLLPAAVVSAYTYWLLFSALSSDPSSCNSLYDQTTSKSGRSVVHLLFGIFISCGSICYAAWNTGTNRTIFGDKEVDEYEELEEEQPKEQQMKETGKSKESTNDIENGTGKAAAAQQSLELTEAEKDAVEDKSSLVRAQVRASRFHLVMCCASMYMLMLITNWGDRQTATQYETNSTVMWIKIVTEWCTIALYTWTLIAPRLCGDREFS